MGIICWRSLTKYHTLYLLKIRKDVAKFSSAAVMIGPLRVKHDVCSKFNVHVDCATVRSKMHDNRTIPFFIEMGKYSKYIITAKGSVGYIPV